MESEYNPMYLLRNVYVEQIAIKQHKWYEYYRHKYQIIVLFHCELVSCVIKLDENLLQSERSLNLQYNDILVDGYH